MSYLTSDKEYILERVMGIEPTISCLGSKRSTAELHPQAGGLYQKTAVYFISYASRLMSIVVSSNNASPASPTGLAARK